MFNRGLGKSDAWEGVVTDKERSSSDGQNMYHHVVVTLPDGTVKVIRGPACPVEQAERR